MPGKLEQLRERYANQDDAAEPLSEAPQPIDTGLCVRCSHTRDEHRLGPGGSLSPTPGRCRRREQATKSGAWRACTCPAYQDPVVGVVKKEKSATDAGTLLGLCPETMKDKDKDGDEFVCLNPFGHKGEHFWAGAGKEERSMMDKPSPLHEGDAWVEDGKFKAFVRGKIIETGIDAGAGTTRESETIKCGSCLGRGKVKARAFAGVSGETTFIKCGDCKGSGRVPID